MHTLLFDIDGTLLFSGGAGQLAMQRAMETLHAGYREVDIPVHGRTDRAIIADLLLAHQIEPTEHQVRQFYDEYVAQLAVAITDCAGAVLKGVAELLAALGEREDVALGLLTGNGRAAAEIKLGHYRLIDYFPFGGFGEHTDQRNEIARIAFQSATQHLGSTPNLETTWVIGDTVHDIACARSIQARVLAVGTGKVNVEELIASEPDAYLDDLGEIDAFVQQVELD